MQDPTQRHPQDDLLQWQVLHLALADLSRLQSLPCCGVSSKPNPAMYEGACW